MSIVPKNDNLSSSGAPDSQSILHEEHAEASSFANSDQEELIVRWEAVVVSQKMTRGQAIRCHPDREVRMLRVSHGFNAPHWPAPPTLRLIDLSYLDEPVHTSRAPPTDSTTHSN